VLNSSFCIARRPLDDNVSANDLGLMNICCPYCDALHWLDEQVSSSRVGQPEFQTRCGHGKVKLCRLRDPPTPLYNLFTGDNHEAKEFRSNIVQYNAAFAFTSLGAKAFHLSHTFRKYPSGARERASIYYIYSNCSDCP